MRGIRWLALCGAIALLAAVVVVSTAGATRLSASGAVRSTAPRFAGIRAPQRASAPIFSTGLAGYATFKTGSSSASSTFKVASPGCSTGVNSGVAEVSFVFAGPTTSEVLDGAGVLDQCSNGTVTITPALIVGGTETNFTNAVHVGDTISTSVSVGPGGTKVTVQDLTAPRTFTQSQTGTDTAPDTELIGIDTTTINGAPVPIGNIGATKFTASQVGGTAIGTQSPSKVIMANGCSELMIPGPIDSTHLVFSVLRPPFTVSGLTPASGPVGTTVKIAGTGFTSTSTVKFGSVAATTVTHTSATELDAKVPTGATTATVSVTNTVTPKGTVSTACTFKVTPHITSFSPGSGPVGTVVTINGTNLSPVSAVKFNTTKATTVHVVSSSQLTATVPTGATTGKISVTTPSGTGTSSTSFTVT